MTDQEPEKPAFLQCCLVCNEPVPAGGEPPRAADGSDLRELLAGHVSPAAQDELAIVETVCAPCLAALRQWDATRRTARQLHQSLAARYRAARKRRAACVLSLHLDRLVVQMPYGAFLLNARRMTDQSWPELVRRVAAAVLESAGITRTAVAGPRPPVGTRTVGCQTPADDTKNPELPAASVPVSVGTEPEKEVPGQPRSAAARRRRGRPPRSARHQPRVSGGQPPPDQPPPPLAQPSAPPPQPLPQPPVPEQSPPPQRPPVPDQPPPPLLACLRGWEGITNVQPSAPPRPAAGAQKRVGFEDLKEQAARARDLEETLSILSVADTASLLDRAETLSVFSDTADLSTLADDNWTTLDLSGVGEPDSAMPTAGERQPESTPSVSFAEPSDGSHPTAGCSIDKGEDLLREFAETMSNISEGVVLEDLEGYFEEIDRPCPAGGGRPASAAAEQPSAPAPAAAPAPAPDHTAQCPICHKEFRHRRYLRPHLRLHDGSLYRCEHCDAPFLHYYKLQLHLRRRHGLALKAGRASSAAARPPPGQRRDAAGKLTCADCGRRFTHLTTLRQHEKMHRGQGYPCTSCDKVFPSKSELTRHADTHRAEKLYKCEECGKAFQMATSLARHRILHTDRAARCDLCGKGFDRKDTMLKHRETHRASSEHSCHICGNVFKQRRILAKHIKLIHGVREHVCSICRKAFSTSYELLGHQRRKHVKPEPVTEPITVSSPVKGS